jgi:ComEC/Rec2-related protein
MNINKALKKRPAFTVFIILLAGLYAGSFIDIRIFLVGFLLSVVGYFIKRLDILLLIALFFSAGVYQSSRTPQKEDRIFFMGIYLDNRILDPVLGEIYVSLPIDYGNFVRGNGKFIESKNFTKLVDVEIKSSTHTILGNLLSFRSYLDAKIQKQCPGDIGKMCTAITLGIRNTLPYYIVKRFQSCGTAHLLAVSGLHTGIVFGIFFVLLRALQLRRNASLFLSEFFVLIYAVLTGLRVPVIRTSIMTLFFVIGESRSRNIDPFNILSAAGIFIVLLMPRSIFSISFQLSFLAVFSILVMFNILKEHFEKLPNRWFKQWIILPFFITLSAQLGTLPLVAYYFGYIPLIGLLANLILVPLTGILISGCFMFFLLPFLGKITGNFVWVVGFIINRIMIIMERTPYAVLKIKKNEPWVLVIYAAYLIPLVFRVYRKTRQDDLEIQSQR